MRRFFAAVLRKLGLVSSDSDAAPLIPSAVTSSASPIALNSALAEWRDHFDTINKVVAPLCCFWVFDSLTTVNGRDSGLGIVPLFCLYFVWCAFAALQKILSLPDDFQKARESVDHSGLKLATASFNAIYYIFIYPAAILWPLGEAMSAFVKAGCIEWFSTDRLLGSRIAAVFNSVAFAGDLLSEASKGLYTGYRARQKSDPLMLLQDRYHKYQNALTKTNPNIPLEKQERLLFEWQALYIACANHDEWKNKIISLQLNVTINPTLDTRTACISANYLLRKQEHKARTALMETVANVFGMSAALLGARSTATDVDAKTFLWPSSMLYMSYLVITYIRFFGSYCSGEAKVSNPDQYIREIFGLAENAFTNNIISKNGKKLVAARPSLLTASSVGAFFVIPRTGTSSDGETTPPQRSEDNDTVSAASLLAATTTPPEIASRSPSS